eukprot:2444860-Amphidinium_carterae.2
MPALGTHPANAVSELAKQLHVRTPKNTPKIEYQKNSARAHHLPSSGIVPVARFSLPVPALSVSD